VEPWQRSRRPRAEAPLPVPRGERDDRLVHFVAADPDGLGGHNTAEEITATLVVPPPTFSGRTATMLPGRPADHLFRLDASIGWRWGGWLSSIEDYQYCSRSGR